MAKAITYIINDSEISAGTRGTSLGPGALRVVDDTLKNYLFSKYPIHYIKTLNYYLDSPTPYKFAKRIDGLVKLYKFIADSVCKERQEKEFLIIMAGDHGSAGGTLAGLKMANPSNRIGVLWIDAHADMHSPYTTPSGNMHGMPLATALNKDNLECQRNELSEDVIQMWNKLKNMGGIAPKVLPQDLGCIAFRDMEEEEIKLMERENIPNITVDELRKIGIDKVIERLEEKYKDCDEIYVSFDVDSMDPDIVSHGTGTPVEHGITPEEASVLLKHFAKHPKVKCIEFVEINPCLDEKINRMAEVTYKLIKEVVETVEQK
ncbi:MAG: arginase [Brumimicrobium sp.]|nr:arginase [Brumimicrobium sp.]